MNKADCSQCEAMSLLWHELSGPLFAARDLSRLAYESLHEGVTTERLGQILQGITAVCRSTELLVQNIRLYVVPESLSSNRETGHETGGEKLLQLATEAVERAKLLAEARELHEWIVEPMGFRELGGLTVQGDERLLAIALGNLVDNAGKFSYPQSKIRISGRGGGRGFEISVRNRGAMMTGAEIKECTSAFWHGRGALTSHRYGLGLGLWATKAIMETIGGQLRISSRGGETIAALTFPVVRWGAQP